MEVERERQDEIVNNNNNDDDNMAAPHEDNTTNINGSSYSSRLRSLLASKDRDFLLSPNDSQVKIYELESKIVGIYFSANWYPPCRKFNQLLINVYEQLKSQGSNFEVVLVSLDEDLSAFNNHRACMPWLSVPFSDLESRRALSRTFDVEGIPSLIVLQPANNTNTESNNTHDGDEYVNRTTLHDGVELIYRYGIQAFPFTKERLEELYKEEREREERQTLLNLLANHDRDYVLGHPSLHQQLQLPVASLEGKTIGLYFSAQWCLPCIKFTPKLVSIYRIIKHKLSTMAQETTDNSSNEDFEIVFISSDHDQASFNSYFGTMPWLALPYGDPNIKELAKHFDIRGIPCLVILGPDGKTVTKQGRNLINLYQENAYPFTEARLEFLERQMDEAAKNLPRSAFHMGHHHELNLVSEETGGGPFICCQCDEQGSGWAYQCLECGYEVHPKCVRIVERPNT